METKSNLFETPPRVSVGIESGLRESVEMFRKRSCCQRAAREMTNRKRDNKKNKITSKSAAPPPIDIRYVSEIRNRWTFCNAPAYNSDAYLFFGGLNAPELGHHLSGLPRITIKIPRPNQMARGQQTLEKRANRCATTHNGSGAHTTADGRHFRAREQGDDRTDGESRCGAGAGAGCLTDRGSAMTYRKSKKERTPYVVPISFVSRPTITFQTGTRIGGGNFFPVGCHLGGPLSKFPNFVEYNSNAP